MERERWWSSRPNQWIPVARSSKRERRIDSGVRRVFGSAEVVGTKPTTRQTDCWRQWRASLMLALMLGDWEERPENDGD